MTLYFPLGGERCGGLKAQTLGKYDADLNQLHIGVEHDDTLGITDSLHSGLKLKWGHGESLSEEKKS